MKKPTDKQRAALLVRFKRVVAYHCEQIGKHRDALRELIDEAEEVVSRTDEGLEDIQNGLSRISEYV